MKYEYYGICNVLRNSSTREIFFQEMLKEKKQVSIKNFKANVNLKPFIEEGESIDSYIQDRFKEDPNTKFYKSKWNTSTCYFIQTCGFEYIFI